MSKKSKKTRQAEEQRHAEEEKEQVQGPLVNLEKQETYIGELQAQIEELQRKNLKLQKTRRRRQRRLGEDTPKKERFYLDIALLVSGSLVVVFIFMVLGFFNIANILLGAWFGLVFAVLYDLLKGKGDEQS